MFNTPEVLKYCERHGIYELYKENGSTITYYSYYGDEGYFKVVRNCKTGFEVRQHLRYKNCPKFLKGKFGVRYNYFVG